MALFNKTNVPISTVQGSSDNYSDEINKLQELVMKTNRSNTGQVSWQSSTSGNSYNTADYSSNTNIYNKGETGLYNLLIYLYGNSDVTGTIRPSFILTADNFNDVLSKIDLMDTNISNITSGSTTVDKANRLSNSSAIGSTSVPVYFNSAGVPVACTSINLNTTGNAATATTASKLGTATVGSSAIPIYLNAGTPTACGTLSVSTSGNAATATKLAAGRTLKVNLGSTNASTAFDGSANITDIGVSGTLPVANGGTGKTSLSQVSVGAATTATKLSNTTAIGSSTKPVYFTNGGVPSECGSSLDVNITGNAATATSANSASSATTASKLGSSTLGNASTPIYLNNGTATQCSAYAGGTAVTLNGTSKAASTASFYAPTGGGTAGQYLRSNGTGAPTWRASVYIRTSGYPDNPVVGDICIHY